MRSVALPLLLALAVAPGAARAEAGKPREMEAIGVDEHLGEQVPPGLVFQDSLGNQVRLGDLFDSSDEQPILLITGYYDCSMLCNLVLNGVAKAMDGMDWVPGDQYRVVTVSFDPDEGPADAKRKKDAILSGMRAPVSPEVWPFLTGDQARIDELLTSLGERVHPIGDGDFSHPAVTFVLTPEGRISRYLYGIEFPPRDLKLALLEASEGKTGSTTDKILMACFHYDPAQRRYGLFISGFLKVGAAAVGLMLAGGLVLLWRRDSKKKGKGDR